jgi:hypothetical protein
MNLQAGRHQAAVDSYTAALAEGATHGFAALLHCNRAAAQQALGRLPDALADCGRARALNPTWAKARAGLVEGGPAGLDVDVHLCLCSALKRCQ